MFHALAHQPGEHEHDPQRRGRLALEVAVACPAGERDCLEVLPTLDPEVIPPASLLAESPTRCAVAGDALKEGQCLPGPALVDGPLAEHPAAEPADRARRSRR